jgi:hypothetical protein
MSPVARLILREHKRNPFNGVGLIVGRQTIRLTIEEAKAMILEEEIELRDVVPQFDTDTRGGRSGNYISDTSFFALFTDMELHFLDVTDYEKADIIHNLENPPPKELLNRFDFIWNGSCLDNIFDSASAQKNTCKMLRQDGGRILTMEIASPDFEAYSMFSQAWFFDYYAINNFGKFESYTCVFPQANIWTGPYKVYCSSDYLSASSLFPKNLSKTKAILTISIAQSKIGSETDKTPIQHQYRSDHVPYIRAYQEFTSYEKLLKPESKNWKKLASKGFIYLGKLEGVSNGVESGVKAKRRYQLKRILGALLNPSQNLHKLIRRLI